MSKILCDVFLGAPARRPRFRGTLPGRGIPRGASRAGAFFAKSCAGVVLLAGTLLTWSISESWAADPPASEEKPAVLPKPVPGRKQSLALAFRKDTPTSLEDLRTMEKHVRSLIARVSPAVVAVEVGNVSGSGVVISRDGLVLSAAHVGALPDRDVRFTFPDGKTAKGKTLGTNHNADAGLMRITDEGPWPFAEISDPDQAVLGDWVLALGHPGGFDPKRSVVTRLGRIIRIAPGILQTDCTIISGDSGGPLFDMSGRVLGIHSLISDSTAENFHVAIGAYLDTWDRLAAGENWGGRGPRSRGGTPWVGIWGKDHAGGFRVELVNRDGPGDRVGVKVGDIVTKINGKAVKDYAFFSKQVLEADLDDEVTIEVKRIDTAMTFKLTVEARPSALGPPPPIP